jgi:uncharacterized membrane protein
MATVVSGRSETAVSRSALERSTDRLTRVSARVQSIDLLRGAVMMIMAIDHIRDFLHADSQLYSPEDLMQASTAMFFTRWITHFCAPNFVFLAGTGAYLSMRNGKSKAEVAHFLVTRGLWLIVAEMTVVLLGSSFNLTYGYIVWQVMWALGWSMMALSLLIYLPAGVLLAASLVVIAGHNLLDGLQPEQFGSLAWLWQIIHVGPSIIQLSSNHTIFVVYPLVPWIAVMAAGFSFGRIYNLDPIRRRRLLVQLGAGLTVAFMVIRALNGYGDPDPWSVQPSPLRTLVSFLRTSKYPPSLLYLLMTLGPSIVILGLIDDIQVGRQNPLLVFGRVPFFYYVIHWYALHTAALVMAAVRYGRYDFVFGFPPSMLGPGSVGYPPDWGFSLTTVYVVWVVIIALLYPVCLWFAGVKARSRSTLLSYL